MVPLAGASPSLRGCHVHAQYTTLFVIPDSDISDRSR
jgi:hypothetical protein